MIKAKFRWPRERMKTLDQSLMAQAQGKGTRSQMNMQSFGDERVRGVRSAHTLVLVFDS